MAFDLQPHRRGRAGPRWVHVPAPLSIGFALVSGMGVTKAYVMTPCAGSPAFAVAGEHGRGLC